MTVKNKALKQDWLVLVMFTLFSIPGFAQSIGPQMPSQPSEESVQSPRKPIHVDVSLVLVNVTVTDLYDRLVTGLGKENFRVFEDGTQQEIVNFSTEDLPISIGLIFDMSGSMSDKLEKARQAAVQFLKTANPRDEFFLVSFNDRAQLTSDFTSSVEELQNRMVYTSAKGQTALLDGIYLGLSQRNANNGKHALLIISDGGDNHSRYNESDLRKFLKEADCQLYAIGVFDSNDLARTVEESYGPTLLSELADIGGAESSPCQP